MKILCGLVPIDGIVGRLVRNPDYNDNKLSLHGWCGAEIPQAKGKDGFHAALAASIAESGLRNPVLIYSLPEGDFLAFGTSRYHAVRSLGHDTIFAIVNDHSGRHADGFAEVTLENAHEFFQDPPRLIEIGPDGLDYHYSIERNRRGELDPAGLAWIDGDPSWLKKEFPWIPTGASGPSGRPTSK